MNQFNPQDNDHDDRRLDEMLAIGSPEIPDDSRVGRLESFWQQVSLRRVRKQRAVAGAIGLALLVMSVPFLRSPTLPNNVRSEQQVADTIDVAPPSEAKDDIKDEYDVDRSFETTMVFHQLVGNAGSRHFSERRKRRLATKQPTNIGERLSKLLVEGQDLNRSELLVNLRTQFADLESTLIQYLMTNDLSPAERQLGLTYLADVAGERSLPTFLHYYRQSEFVELVAPAIANLVSAEQVFQFAVTATSAETRCLFARALLGGDSHRLGLFLSLVEQSQTTQMALNCIAKIAEPPTPQLFQFLSSSNRRLRLLAALALGQVDDNDAVQQLMQLTLKSRTRFPAMVALASSKNQNAIQFVQFAQFDNQLADSVQSAQSLLDSVSKNFTEKG